jgi:trk system potassium uptake protein TrkH
LVTSNGCFPNRESPTVNLRLTLQIQGILLLFLGALLLLPIPFALVYWDGQVLAFLGSSAIALAAGGLLFRCFRSREEITHREGFAIVTLAWAGYALFGALPYLFSSALSNPIDAVFEAMSGFATAGASVFTDVEAVPKSVLFWRATTQWAGGMGLIVFGVAILPFLGVGGMQLYEAETPSITPDRLTPRIQDTARLLWEVYALITGVGIVLLWMGDMDFFEAVCHAFAAVATGGFSTRNASLGAFSTYSQVITILLMVLGGANFTLHYYALRGKVGSYWKSDELRLYMSVLLGAILIVFLFNWTADKDVLGNLGDSAFTVTSIVTTTGFATADYERWPVFSQGLLFALMFFGGCAGSTAGGIKHVRALLLLRHAYLQMLRLVHPRRVLVLKLDRQGVAPETMQDVLGLVVLFLGVFVTATLLLAATGIDLLTAGSGVIACMSTVGPGLGELGPMDNYAHLPAFAKIVLTLCMLLGRLEIYTVVVLCLPSVWKK